MDPSWGGLAEVSSFRWILQDESLEPERSERQPEVVWVVESKTDLSRI